MRRGGMLAVAATLLLAGCGSDQPDREAAAPTLPSTTTAEPSSDAPPSGPVRSDRGNIIKALGEEGGICGPGVTECTEEALVLTFTVDSITVGVECTSGFSVPPDNGNYIGIGLRVATSADYPADWFATFTAGDFRIIGPDGLTITDVQGQAASCLGDNGFTYQPIGPGQQYAGTVVLDSPVTSGVLVYAPPGMGGTGWEWPF